MDNGNFLAVISLLLPISFIILLVAAYSAGMIDLFVVGVATAIIIVLVIVVIAMFFVGAHAFVKKKDTVHYGSSMTLDDVTEVDREMEKK